MQDNYAIIIAPNWGAGGSNNIFANQISYYREKGWSVVLVLVNEFKNKFSINQFPPPSLSADIVTYLSIPKSIRYARYIYSVRIKKNDREGPVHRNFMNKVGSLDPELLQRLAGKRLRELCVNWFDNVDAAVRIRSLLRQLDAPIVVHTHDVMARHRYMHAGRVVDISEFELAALAKADRLIHVSDDDKEYFEKRIRKKNITSYITLSPEVEGKFNNIIRRPIPRSVLYIGSWNYFNPKGVEWFFRQVIPYLKNDISFYFAGDICKFLESNLWHESHAKNIYLLYRVDDIYDLYSNMQMAMLPDLGITGASVKLVEALAMNIPFVATPAAIRGVPSSVKAALMPYVAEKPRDFADLIDAVLTSPTRWDGRSIYLENFSNSAWAKRIDFSYDDEDSR